MKLRKIVYVLSIMLLMLSILIASLNYKIYARDNYAYSASSYTTKKNIANQTISDTRYFMEKLVIELEEIQTLQNKHYGKIYMQIYKYFYHMVIGIELHLLIQVSQLVQVRIGLEQIIQEQMMYIGMQILYWFYIQVVMVQKIIMLMDLLEKPPIEEQIL